MYVCGPTVYDQPHIGHARSAYVFDVIRRFLIYKGYKVKFVRNVTDVDDKIIERAKSEFPGEDLNTAFKKVAEKYLASYHDALAALNIEAGIFEPKASEYIAKMQVFISGLIEKSMAYVAGGDVYFDMSKARDYGKLSNQSLEKMESGARVSPNENKRNPLDFALWKTVKENEPSWDSPWGKGRPGWHIECSVMSSDILGDEFDIHGGGIDLIFPHHENEIAQSEAAGKKFARCWIHHGLLTINGQKMSKSLGNFVTVSDFLDKHKNGDLLKLIFLTTHYAHPVDYSEKKVEEAREALERIMILRDKLEKIAASRPDQQIKGQSFALIDEIDEKFTKAMDDDFNTPQGLAAIFELIGAANKHIDDAEFVSYADEVLSKLLVIFGIGKKINVGESANIEDFVKRKIIERENARKEKNFAQADKIRKELVEKGIILEDVKGGETTWRRKL
jgi:cysteinyl-tRNA synthetase